MSTTEKSSDYLSRAKALREDLVAFRRDIHRNPELAFKEERTAGKGVDWLKALGLDVQTQVAGTTGVVATLDTGKPGPTVLLRGDMDALPITEATGVDFASTNGAMHACGHDVHTTCVLGAARLLSERKDALRGRIKFLLQPAEEVPPGGAKVMIEQGKVLEGVDAALALHVTNQADAGVLGFRAGAMLAYSDRFTIEIKGVGGHAARPQLAVDAVAVAVQVYNALQYVVSRGNNPLNPLVLTIGSLQAGTVANVIPASARMLGTARSLHPETAEMLPEKLERTVAGICAANGAEYSFEYLRGYPSLVNDAALVELGITAATDLLGPDGVWHIPTPEMGGEDFAYFSQAVPSMMFRLGVRNTARGIVHPMHHPGFDVDEDALPVGTAALARMAADYVTRG